jgi:hypothetical protein
MNREERIEKARRMAAANSPQPEEEAQKRADRIYQRLSQVGAGLAQRHVLAAEQSDTTVYVGPADTPWEWEQAVELARLITIKRAQRRDTITFGEIRWAILDDIRMLVDQSTLANLAMGVNRESDGVLLSSLIVHEDGGKPDEAFLQHAANLGFDLPLAALQRQAYRHFS